MTLLEIAAGLVLGYVVGSVLESLVHEYIGDAPPRVLAFYCRHARLFSRYVDAHFSHHVIHHHRTFVQSHVRQFDTVHQRAKLEAFLAERGAHGREIIRNGFSDRLHTESIVTFSMPWIVAGTVIALLAPPVTAIAAALALTLAPWLSHVIHPYVHMTFDEGQRRAPPLVAALLRTRYMRAVYRAHFMHHRHASSCNYNLVLGGDWLRRRWRRADEDDLAAMREAGMPVD